MAPSDFREHMRQAEKLLAFSFLFFPLQIFIPFYAFKKVILMGYTDLANQRNQVEEQFHWVAKEF